MKITLLYIILITSFSSCQTYQYLSLSGTNIAQDSSHQFVVENDTLLLQYNFSGYNGPVKITVYNKTSMPIFIDWRKSAIIFGDNAHSYYSPTMQLSGTTSTIGYRYNYNLNSTGGSVEATIIAQEGVDFIPPYSQKVQSKLYVINGYLKDIPEEIMTKKYLWPDRIEFRKMKTIDFTQENSPIHLRSYLTFSTNDHEFSMEHQFYVSQIFQSMVRPSVLTPVQGKGNYFYSSKATGVGAVVGVGIVVGLLAWGSHAEPDVK